MRFRFLGGLLGFPTPLLGGGHLLVGCSCSGNGCSGAFTLLSSFALLPDNLEKIPAKGPINPAEQVILSSRVPLR